VNAQELAFILECFTKGGCLTGSLPVVHIVSIWFSFAGASLFILIMLCLQQNK